MTFPPKVFVFPKRTVGIQTLQVLMILSETQKHEKMKKSFVYIYFISCCASFDIQTPRKTFLKSGSTLRALKSAKRKFDVNTVDFKPESEHTWVQQRVCDRIKVHVFHTKLV